MWSYLPVTFDGIFTSTNIIKWGINSVGTQYLWSFTQPFIIHCITSRLILNWNTFRQIEKYKWSPSGYFHRYKPKLLSSWASRSPRLQSTSKIAEKPNQIKKKKNRRGGGGGISTIIMLPHTFTLKSSILVVLVALSSAPSNP